MSSSKWQIISIIFAAATGLSFTSTSIVAHEHTLPAALERQREARLQLLARAELDASDKQQLGSCELTIELVDAETQQPIAGNVRVLTSQGGEALALTELISRPNQWFAMPGRAVVKVPQNRLSIAAFHGINTNLAKTQIDLRGKDAATVRLPLMRFYRPRDHKLVSGNTHLHLNRISRQEADRYLKVVPRADDLDLLYVSHLRRAVDDESYVTNQYEAEDLAHLSDDKVTYGYGQEHRHNFEAYGEGYGHVMFLDIKRLIEPVSIGPGLTQIGSDGIPLRRGIDKARIDGASVIWCHNSFGVEDLPNWMSGVLHAQNIFDGGDHGSYKDTYYRYLNIGIKVPFSTGTDWFIYDLSRVYVPMDPAPGKRLASSAWLRQLSDGRSYITNGTFLELSAGNQTIGDVIQLDQPGTIDVVGRGVGRNDFGSIELVHNGRVIHSANSKHGDNHYESALKFALEISEPGWVALRVPLQAGENEFGETLFGHTSPIYIELGGKHIFQPEVAQDLLVEMERNISIINSKGVFHGNAEREAVLEVHRQGIEALKQHVREGREP